MVPDRPEFTATSTLVGAGFVEFEDGFTIGNEGSAYTFSGPETMMRVGLSKRVELRLDGDGFLADWTAGAKPMKGRSDFETSVKTGLFGQKRFRPSVSIITSVSIPAGSAYFSSNGYDPTVKLAWDKDLVKGFAIGGNLDLGSITTPEGRVSQRAMSWSVSRDLGAGFGLFGEVYDVSALVAGNPSLWSGDGGITRAIGGNVEIDLRAGRRFNDVESNWCFGAGIAIRQPAKWVSRGR